MKVLVDVAPIDVEAEEVLVEAWAEILRQELAAAQESAARTCTDRDREQVAEGLNDRRESSCER